MPMQTDPWERVLQPQLAARMTSKGALTEMTLTRHLQFWAHLRFIRKPKKQWGPGAAEIRHMTGGGGTRQAISSGLVLQLRGAVLIKPMQGVGCHPRGLGTSFFTSSTKAEPEV